MIEISELPESLEREFPAEFARFREFLASHVEQTASLNGREIPYCICGRGARTILTFAGGWGGIELVYETILGFEGRNRVVVVDISGFDHPDEMNRGINLVLDEQEISRVVLLGQSLSAILAQLFFRRHAARVEAMVLTNTPSPKREHCRNWARLLFACLPFYLVRVLLRRKMRRLERFDQAIPPAVEERRRFAHALLGQMTERRFTRELIGRILKLAWRFNEQGEYAAGEFRAWNGRILLITSEDDPYHAGSEILKSVLPAAEQYVLPSGFGHLAPQICLEEFQSTIQQFLDDLGPQADGSFGRPSANPS
jgi:pimeloyl-ACP methyl ester carboxylesterase